MSENIFKTMVEMQHHFNEQTIPNYLEKNLNWNSAIIAESGELLDSLGYKWWKKQEPDMENVKVEAIDLLHFVISETLQKFYNTPSRKHEFLNRTIIELNYCFQDDYEFIQQYKKTSIEELIGLFLKSYPGQDRLLTLKIIFHKLNMSNEDVYIAYITKNCLNKFRQNNGYKDGTYIKDWNGKEDNIIAFEIANEWGADEELFEQLYLDLETYYNEEVLKKTKETHISNMLDDLPDYFKCNELN